MSFEGTNQDRIDPKIVGVCKILNNMVGVKTIFSCEGHAGELCGYISFTCEVKMVLEKILKSLSPITIGNHNKEFPFLVFYVKLEVELCQGRMVYCIRWGGFDDEMTSKARDKVIDAIVNDKITLAITFDN